ncbi:Pfs domain-containing protein [Mycena venus]|uniref:Pfs domain-containing protein n=1 Tax=Mycena venus TaxID=2733690 RepID=A0A8H7CWQ9_9AGAR|nr:Pfs domain-containing protein [Mycena venus]
MIPFKAISTESSPASVPQSKTSQLVDGASTVLEATLKVLELLGSVTDKVPYLNIITGCISKLIEIRNEMTANKERASDLLSKIGEITRVVAQGLQDLDENKRSVAVRGLENDLKRYQSVLNETCGILKEWTTQGFLKRTWKHGDFPAIADGIDRRIDAFHDAFSVARLTALSTGQDALDVKMQTLVDKAKRAELNKWLKPANVGQSQKDAADKYHPGTGAWLLECAEFREWIYAPNSLLWLSGISGSGKTVLSSTIIDKLRTRMEPYAFFYFDTNNSGQQTVSQLLCSLVTQLSVQLPSLDKILHEVWKSNASGQHFPSNSQLISEALIPILTEFTQPVYLVLDALDECSEREKLLDAITSILDSELFNVHLLVTSRPEVHYGTNVAQQGVSISLEDCVTQDIESYVDKLLSEEDGWISENKEAIKQGLLDHGGGMFRLVSLQLDELRNCSGRQSEIEEALLNMPTSLTDIYHRILRNIRRPSMVSDVGRTINWLMFSMRPMALDEIIDALAFNFKKKPLCFNKAERMKPKALLDACAGFVSISQGEYDNFTMIKLAHASVKEYFLSVDGQKEISSNCEVSEQAAHYLITQTCLGYLKGLDSVLDRSTASCLYPLAEYAAKYWAIHARHCNEIKQDLSLGERWSTDIIGTSDQIMRCKAPLDTMIEILQYDSPQYIMLSRLHRIDNGDLSWYRESSSYYPTLYYSAFLGIPQLTRELLLRGLNINTQSGRLGNALQVACYMGHLEIVDLLLEKGVDMKAQGGEYGNVLQAASYNGSLEIVCLLLEKGADVNAQGGLYGNALQASSASYKSSLEIVGLLLEKGADVNAQGGEYGNALQAASYRGHFEIVGLLLEKGADVNTQGGEYGNALRAASSQGHFEIVGLLLEKGADVNAQSGQYGNALQAVSYWGHFEIVGLLLEKGADVNAQGGEYGNALQAAINQGHFEIVGLLLEKGADVNTWDGKYGNALQAAINWGHFEIVGLLLEKGADVNAQGGEYGNALQAASHSGSLEIVCLLLGKGAYVNAQGGKYGNALQAASVSYNSSLEIVGLLLEKGADVNAQGGQYGNALQAASASYYSSLEIVGLLLEKGADVNTQGGHYGNALQAASSQGHFEILELLHQKGAIADTIKV